MTKRILKARKSMVTVSHLSFPPSLFLALFLPSSSSRRCPPPLSPFPNVQFLSGAYPCGRVVTVLASAGVPLDLLTGNFFCPPALIGQMPEEKICLRLDWPGKKPSFCIVEYLRFKFSVGFCYHNLHSTFPYFRIGTCVQPENVSFVSVEEGL